MSIESEAIQWLNATYEKPPKGWMSAKDIARKKGISARTAKIKLDDFVFRKMIKGKKFFQGGRWTTFYDTSSAGI